MDKHAKDYFNTPNAKPFLMEGEKGKPAILFIHGFTGSIAHMRPLADGMHAAGYTVRGINLPGHASYEDDMAAVTWKDYLQAAKMEAVQLKKKYGRVVVCGLSMGGVLTLLLAEQSDIDGAIPVSAPMDVQQKALRFSGIIAPLYKRVSWGGGNDSRASQLDQRYDLGYTGFPTRSGADLWKLIKLARKDLFAITCPILVVQSDADKTIVPASQQIILSGVQSDVKAKLLVHDVPHVCTISSEKDKIIDAMRSFMGKI